MYSEHNIGLKGTKNEYEFEIIKQTEKAYLLKDWKDREFWFPKIAFDEMGDITKFGIKLFKEKIEEIEYKENKR